MASTWVAFLGLTILVAVLLAVLAFAFLRFASAAREARRLSTTIRPDGALVSSALEHALTRLREQERATAARADASERLSGQLVASLTSGLIVVGGDGRLEILNPAAERILGMTGDVGTDFRDALREVPELAAVIEEGHRTHTPVVRRRVTLQRPDGPMHLGVTVSPLGAGGQASGAICLFSNLTSVVALEEQLRLKEALARLGELTAGLAHEFRNGLATIHGYARLLDPAALPEQYRPYVQGLRDETQALGEIVTNFLRFARPEPLTLAPVDLRSVIARAAEDVTSAATVACTGEFGSVEADEVLLRRAFSNLLRNSVDACTAQGIPPHIEVEGRIDNLANTVTLEVRDNGPGIAADAMSRVFNPFFTTRPSGTGLGLAIVQRIVVSHNGRIAAANHPGGGAVFRIWLPVRASVPASET